MASMLVGCSSSGSSSATGASSALPLTLVTDLPLPGGTTRLDYQDIDPNTHRLYIAHLGDGTVHVVDLDSLTVTATDHVVDSIDLTGCDTNHGLYIDSDNRLAFVACEGNARLLVVDLDTKQTTARFDIGTNPDVLAFDNGMQRLYVAAESGTVSVFDEANRSLTKVAQAKLSASARTVDQATHRVYFPLENVDGHPTLRVMQPSSVGG